MNVLNIHGYAGTAENTNYSILHEAGYNVISFAIDYDSCAASDVEEFLLAAVKVYQIGLIVATSYGSYFANILSAKLDIPFIATNPCVSTNKLEKAVPRLLHEGRKKFKVYEPGIPEQLGKWNIYSWE